MQTFDLKKLFNNEATKNLIFVNEATSIPFDANFGDICQVPLKFWNFGIYTVMLNIFQIKK